MRTFLLTWSGEIVSLVGSGLTSFALGIWIYQRTGSTTLFALNSFCAILPLIVVSPLVGPLIDRCIPIAAACNQAIWQVKTPLELQGRVFAIRAAIAMSSMPLAHLLSGPLADDIFEPLLAVDGPLASNVGSLIGVGPGRGIALLLIVTGILTCLGTTLGLLSPRLRRLEEEMPDAAPLVAGAALPSTEPS